MAGVSRGELRRDMFPASGPMVIAEHSRKPWRQKVFANKWREIARAMGIPDNVQNRDSRAGGATDAETKGADIEKTRKGLGHAKPETTRIYTRGDEEATAEIAYIRFGKQAKDA
jgi:integrase